jgi:hypothetical protein
VQGSNAVGTLFQTEALQHAGLRRFGAEFQQGVDYDVADEEDLLRRHALGAQIR